MMNYSRPELKKSSNIDSLREGTSPLAKSHQEGIKGQVSKLLHQLFHLPVYMLFSFKK
jgi:hypothetical protein